MLLNFNDLNTKLIKKLFAKKYKTKKNIVNQKYCVAKDNLSSCGIIIIKNLKFIKLKNFILFYSFEQVEIAFNVTDKLYISFVLGVQTINLKQ